MDGDALAVWTDRSTRHRLLSALGLPEGTPERSAAVTHIDRAVAAGMAEFGFPRGVVRGVRIRALGVAVRGRKTRESWLEIGDEWIAEMLGPRGAPDGIFKSWIHEALHARLPFTSPELVVVEYPRFPGYEEGLVEGIARWMMSQVAGLVYVPAYSSYIRAYEVLAQVLGMDVLAIWRALWPHPFGTVRHEFPDVIGRLWYSRTERPAVTARLLEVGDQLFSYRERRPAYSDTDLRLLWSEPFDDDR